ncbi:uncharacterized protein PHACADRAFT_262880 [Phanerochaete carnosa HHB-10118-sp]|uniref:CENP-V/GFA domain-containing protein n=1 Tax=Phanerochaete carnosa (strain HHB-10118-sp) TaxID=650164 RepID=K5VVY6_PHACS|nr:uncharacterized protein PHACADRAFT_262880 [Phanerochaete carnosa HHB-10118-sp]EKM50975.1 hypothetical protein PHACADRAFT_262880 [Phanerochaete carnosa HHB-10118-sp]
MSSTADSELTAAIPLWPEGAELKHYTGGCHCRQFRYRLTHPVFEEGQFEVVVCNCSFCTAHGKMNIYALENKFELLSNNVEELKLYQFHARVVEHYFCPTCGVQFLTKALGYVVVNARTVDGVDLMKLKIKHVDLRNT